MNLRWVLLLELEAARFSARVRGLRARRLEVQLDRLLAFPLGPFMEAVSRGISSDGREFYTLQTVDFTIAYWLDVPVREIRVVEINKVIR